MKTIWKFPLEITDRQSVAMPRKSQVLTVQDQGDDLTARAFVWAFVPDTDAECDDVRWFSIHGTGNPIPDKGIDATYLATVQTHGGSLVWHVFVDNPPSWA